ncbi:transcriptional regulator PtsJ [Dokdonella sp.]|uniref:MocR-like B6 salvage transcription factor PtsJ n=1 Tax=Dokdonella sp. TaxID=2291710 RepID=UPI001B052E24|nr:transcriptional regulator PtsJ [Dokdonella sp.]MBO9662747.1 transcriptional regulator PtsJ [Dokdonella sp.]
MRITGSTAAQIFESVRALAQRGELAHGQALPTVRDLAARLGVNRNTVSMAYRRLATAGIASTQGRLGTTVRGPLPAGEQEGFVTGSPLDDLGSGNPDPAWLPDLSSVLARKRYRKRLYGEAPVDPELERIARAWLAPDCPRDFAVDLTHGSVDALERLLSAHLAAGDKVAVEDPCFVSSGNTLRVAGFQILAVPVDARGMRVDALEAALAAGAQAVVVTPRAHNPTGASLDAARARRLRSTLARYPHVLVIVDDHFSQLSCNEYHDVIPRAAGRWALVRSVSKMLGPDLRVAVVASDVRTSQRLRLRLASGTNWVSHLLQDVVVACLSSPTVTRRIAQARADYARRRNILAAALAERNVAVVTPADGLSLWLPLEEDSRPVALALAQRGWLVRDGEAFGVLRPAHGLRVTVSTLDEPKARAFARALGEILGRR